MSSGRILLQLIAWVFGAVGVLLGGLYVVLLIVNWSDVEESAEARALAAMVPTTAQLQAIDNAWPLALGFAAPQGVDARAAGRERLNWLLRLRDEPQRVLSERDPLAGRVQDPVPASVDVSDVARVFDALCWRPESPDDVCLQALNGRDADMAAWSNEMQWLVDRYADLLAHRTWIEPAGVTRLTPWTVLGPLTAGQRIWMVQAWTAAAAGDAGQVRQLLNDDVAFWRRLLTDSATMTGRRLAAERLIDHFRLGAMVLKVLPDGLASEAIPPFWRTPLTDDELDMRRAMVSEWLEAIAWVEQLSLGLDPGAGARSAQPRSFSERIGASLFRPFVKVQDFANRYAVEIMQLHSLLDVPVEGYPDAVEFAVNYRIDAWSDGVHRSLYNPGGRSVLAILDPVMHALARHAAYATDVEGIRRATLLATEMRSAGISDGRGAVLLGPPDLYNPYTDAPFLFEEATGALVFEGLVRSGRRGYRVWY
jgi:hypothetical protein